MKDEDGEMRASIDQSSYTLICDIDAVTYLQLLGEQDDGNVNGVIEEEEEEEEK